MKAEPVWTAACAREVDELSIGTFGIRQTDLMERAGHHGKSADREVIRRVV